MKKIGDIMSTTFFSTTPDTSAFDAVEEMYKNKIGALLIKENKGFVGIFTKTDWMQLFLARDCDPHKVKVGDVMSSPIVTIDRNESLSKATELIEEKKIRHIAVTEEDKIVGMLSVKDLQSYYLQLHEKTNF
jgi:CBS domain-containing protein